MSRFAWLLAPSNNNLSFAVRTCLSVAIALYLAFWLQLDNAYWAFLNVVILIQPLPGLIVVRGFARLAGSAVAAVMAVVLIALFAQSYFLFSTALIVWIGICVFFASLLRNNMAYGFVLAGYVTGIIAVRSMSDPSTVFTVAVARTAETGLAAITAAFVSVILAPSSTARAYFEARLDAFSVIGVQLKRLTGDRDVSNRGGEDPDRTAESRHAELHGLIAKTLALEQTRQYARYDAPGFARYDRLARRVDYELLSLVSAMASLQGYLARLGPRADRRGLQELAGAAVLMSENPQDTQPIKQALGGAYSAILAMARSVPPDGRPRSLADWVIISRTLDLANRARAAVIKHGMLMAESATGRHRRSPDFSFASEPRAALRTSVRAATAMAVGAAIWATHDDPALGGMMVLLSVLTTLFALGDTPSANARGFAVGAFCAAVVAFFADFVLLPQANSYATLMIVILPVVFVGSLAMATPRLALIGRVSLVVFALLVHPANDARMTFVTYAETLMGVGLAIVLAMTTFALILPVSPRGLLRERLAGVFGELAEGFTGGRERFETRIYERLLRLPVHADAGENHVSARRAAFAAVNIGIEARSMRLLARRAQLDPEVQRRIHDELEQLQQLFAPGYPEVARVFEMQRRANQLAQWMLERALEVQRPRRRRYAIRAAVAAELVAAALADYGLTREHVGAPEIRLGGLDHVA